MLDNRSPAQRQADKFKQQTGLEPRDVKAFMMAGLILNKSGVKITPGEFAFDYSIGKDMIFMS